MEVGKEEEHLYGSEESGSEYSSDDSDNDPTYSILEETHSKLSKLSIKTNKAKALINEANGLAEDADSEGGDVVVLPELDEIDEKCFEQVLRIIRGGQIEKLKVDQCKVYLRKNGLRLTGNRATLIQRIKEHLEILNGGGEKKYPVSSFELNCKGDACAGDIVLFEQNVYDMFNVASRSAIGGLCGTRIVAGRIVKESYGAAKQQHTFTIEVLWSRGEKPLPPLHPLLIKGRNLYRLKTLRQRWEDEGKRQKILTEKHSRGSLARSDREVRIQEKEKRKMLKANRISKKEVNRNQSHADSTSLPKPFLQPQNFGLSANSANTEKQAIWCQQLQLSTVSSRSATEAHQSGLASNFTKITTQHQVQAQNSGLCVNNEKVTTKFGLEKTLTQDKYINQASHNLTRIERISPEIHEFQHRSNWPHSNLIVPNFSNIEKVGPNIYEVQRRSNWSHSNHRRPNSGNIERISPDIEEVQHRNNWPRSNHGGLNSYLSEQINWTREFPKRVTHRQPLKSMNNYRFTSPTRRQCSTQQNLCRYYAQGRCYYGDRCKYYHDMRERGQWREERWP